jgi:hypothetical protein
MTATKNGFARLWIVAAFTLAMGSASRIEAAPLTQTRDIVAFCKAHGTLDHPQTSFFGKGDGADPVPEQVARVDGANQWRCLDGQVLLCSDSADGDWCGQKDQSRKASRALRAQCAATPGAADVPFAVGHYSAFDWRCNGRTPVIKRGYPLDRRGFFKQSWAPYVVRRGVVIEPKEMPVGPR